MDILGDSVIKVNGYGYIVENGTLPLHKRKWPEQELPTYCHKTNRYINTEQFQPVLYNPKEQVPKYNTNWEVWTKPDAQNKGELVGINFPQYYKNYVKTQIKRIANGYTVGGTHLTGENYFWLNFWPIIAKSGANKTINPRFLAFQKDLFFDKLQEARATNSMYMAVKMRQAGFTDMGACCLGRTMLLIHDCSCASIAGLWDDASVCVRKMKNGIKNLQRTAPFLYARPNIDTNTVGQSIVYTLEYRDRNTKTNQGPNTTMYQFSNESRTGSEAATGKSYAIALFDEIGKNQLWINAVEKTIPAMKEYEQFNGNLIMAYGTGGDMVDAIEITHQVFMSPRQNNFVSIKNDWKEPGFDSEEIAVFVPGYHYYVTDYDGNTYKEHSIYMMERDVEALRKIKTKQGLQQLRNYHISRPLKLSHIFTSKEEGLFNKELLETQNNRLVEQGLDRIEQYGRFEWVYERKVIVGVKWVPCGEDPEERDFEGDLKYPFLIMEHPKGRQGWTHKYKESKLEVLQYAAGTDPYDIDADDNNEKKRSLGSFTVRKTGKDSRNVGRLTWRPSNKKKFYEQTARATYYFNCQNLIERHNAVIFGHYKDNNYHFLLAGRLRMEKSAIIQDSFDTYFGVDMKIDMKTMGENLLRDDIELNSHLYNDYAANKAFIKYKRTMNGKKHNCDITMSTIIALLHEMQISSEIEEEHHRFTSHDDFWFYGGFAEVDGKLIKLN